MQGTRKRWLAVGMLLMVVFSTSYALAAAPKVTRIQLGAAVADGYIIIPNAAAPSGQTYPLSPSKVIAPGSQDSNDIANGAVAIANAFGPGQNVEQGDASFFGDSGGYGMFIFNVTTGLPTGVQTDRRMAEMNKWLIKNSNDGMMGSSYGPGNISSVSLNNAIASGTSILVTVDMQGNSPHLIAIFGGTPTITYTSAGTGTLVVQSSTITTKNAGGRGGDNTTDPTVNADATDNTITSAFGLMIMTDDQGFGGTPTAPMKLAAWTNAWPGDIFAYGPGGDSSSNKGAGSAGTFGSSSAKFGLTVNGPTADSRTFFMFVPSGITQTLFGSSVTSGDITGYVNGLAASTTSASDSTTYTADGSAVTGVRLSFNYTFASPTDTSTGVASSTAPSSGGGGGGCFIATSVFGSYDSPNVWLLREFRFHYLMPNKIGRAMVRLYEKVSPPIAAFLDSHAFLKPAVKMVIMPGVWFSAFMLKSSLTTKLISMFGVVACVILAAYAIRRRMASA